MRAGKLYTCPECGMTSPVGVTCPRCEVPMIDEHGNPPIPDTTVERRGIPAHVLGAAAFVGGAVGLRLLPVSPVAAAAACLGVLGGGAALWGVSRLAAQVARLSRKRRTERLLEGAEPVAIADSPEGRVKVRGVVRLLRPVTAPDGRSAAAFAWQTVHTERCTCKSSCTHTVKRTVRESAGGRFAVLDATGIAVVDDDCLEVWTTGEQPAPQDAGGTVIIEGATVTVAGPARRGLAADVVSLGASGYRGGGAALLFDGTPQLPVVVCLEA